MGALPLRNLSRVWGYINSLELPVWTRPAGFRLYAWIFGCNLDEVEKDLKEYKSLGDFFYRKLKDGARPVADVVLVRKAGYLRVLPLFKLLLHHRLVLQTVPFFTLAPSRADAWSRSKAAPTRLTRCSVSIPGAPHAPKSYSPRAR